MNVDSSGQPKSVAPMQGSEGFAQKKTQQLGGGEKQKGQQISQETRLYQFLNVIRNKDVLDYEKNNKQVTKVKRRDDKFASDREAEGFEAGYQDFGFGELVMSFPNPDDLDSYAAQGILLSEAMAIYDASLNNITTNVSTQDRDLQRKAFLIAFLLLDDFVEDNEAAREAQEKMKEEKNKKRKKEEEKQRKEEEKRLKEEEKKKGNISGKDSGRGATTGAAEPSIPQDSKTKLLQRDDVVIELKDQSGEKNLRQVSKQKTNLRQKKRKEKLKFTDLQITDLIGDIQFAEESEVPLLGNLPLSADAGAAVAAVALASSSPQKSLLADKTTLGAKGKQAAPAAMLAPALAPALASTGVNPSPKGDLLLTDNIRENESFNLLQKQIPSNGLINAANSVGNTVGQTIISSANGGVVAVPEGAQQQARLEGKKSDQLIAELIEGTMNNDLSSFRKIKKKLNRGKFMYKRKYDQEDFDWIITNHVPRDFQTLLRNTIVQKLSCNALLCTRQILNRGGSQIILSVKASEEVIRVTAENYKINKQIELGYADILSLEPCDSKYRPLRLKYVLRLAVKNCKKKRIDGLDDFTKAQKHGIRPILNLRTYMGQEEDEFWIGLGRKQLYFDGILNAISQEIKIKQDDELVEIIDDNDPLDQKIWSAYSLYLDYMIYYCEKMKSLKNFAKTDMSGNQKQPPPAASAAAANAAPPKQEKVGNIKKSKNHYEKNAAFLYRLIFKQSFEDTNIYFAKVQGIFSFTKKLDNIWDYLEVDHPIPPYTPFQNYSNEEFLLFWRTYEINEFKHRSLFTNMEKIRLCDMIVNTHVNTLKLLSDEIMLNYFPLHEPRQLKGQQKLSYFQKLIEADYISEPSESQTEEKVRKLFLVLNSQADSSDFDQDCVTDELALNFFKPWKLNISSIRDYYGEKIALYFQFLSSYTFHLSYMSVLSVIIEIVIASTKNSYSQTAGGFRFFYGIAIVIWQVAFLEFWKQKQALFAMTYGQEKFLKQEKERPDFKGTFIRSVFNDKLNYAFYPEYKRKIFIFISLLLSLLVVLLVLSIIIALFVLKAVMLEQNILVDAPFINPNALIGILNSIQIIIFNALYMKMNDWMSGFENHEVLETYENSYISKVLMFTFCNTFNSCFFIAFFSEQLKIESNGYVYLDFCKNDNDASSDCFSVLRTQMISIFLINLIKNIPELAVPLLKIFAKRALRKETDTLIIHPFRDIDIFINDQFDLEPYQTNREIDGTVGDYMELVIQFSFLCLFGLAFPSSFILAFANNVVEIQIDKLKLIYVARRPVPTAASDIGTWQLILEIVSFFSIFTNAGLIAFTSDTVATSIQFKSGEETMIKNRVFFITFLALLFVKFLTQALIPDVPKQVKTLKLRHFNCVYSLLNGLNETKARSMVASQPNIFIEQVQYAHPQNMQKSFKEKLTLRGESITTALEPESKIVLGGNTVVKRETNNQIS